MTPEQRNYETTYIVNASMEDAQIEAAITHVAEVIVRNGGTINATNRWGRKRLAYAIEKKNNGYFVNLEFSATGALIAQLERAYLLDENILRFLTIQLDKRAFQAKAKSAAEASAAAAAVPVTPSKTEPPGEKPPEAAAAPVQPAPPAPATAPESGPAKEPEARKPLFGDEEGENPAG